MTTAAVSLDWERLARSVMHPTAIAVLQALSTLEVSSPSALADLFDEPLGNVSYHMRMLHKRGLVRLVRTEPRRGAVEHYYELLDGAA